MATQITTRSLARWMRKARLTQAEFASLIGVSQPTISLWLSGYQPIPARWWAKLSQVTGLPVETFFPAELRKAIGRAA